MKRADYNLAHDYIDEAKRINPEDGRMQYLFPGDKWTGQMEAGYTFVFH